MGRDWIAPVSPAVRDELERLRRERPGVGEVLILPSPTNPARPVTLKVANGWLRRAEVLAEVERLPGGGWHPLRRKWASERKHLSVRDVAAVGGWLDTATLQKCYQAADPETMEAVVMQPKRLLKLG